MRNTRARKYFAPLILFIAAVLAMAVPGSARALMQLGDPAPPISVSVWIQGAPPEEEDGRKPVLVIEFWMPDCPHCLNSVPLLNDLQKRFDDQVAVIGMTDAGLKDASAFLADAEEPVRYRIALDDGGDTERSFMEGFGVQGVPHAFVVDRRGRIVWEGHPLDGLDRALEEVVAGTYDLKARRRHATAEKLIPVYLYLAEQTRETALIDALGRRIAALAWNDVEQLHRFAKKIAFNPAIDEPDTALALRLAERAREIDGGADPELEKTRTDLRRRVNGAGEQNKRHPQREQGRRTPDRGA